VDLTITLTAEQLGELAERVAALLLPREPTPAERLLKVDELAAMLDTDSGWVRRHQAELGGYRLSEGGGRAPIRFRMSEVERFLAEHRLAAPAKAGGWRDDPDWASG
jgi:hypothetical protein